MKRTVLMLICCLAMTTISAQKVIEKNIKPSSDAVEVEFKFAEDINIKTWDKNEVYVKAEVSINDGEYDDYFTIKVDNDRPALRIDSDYGDLFKKQNTWRRNKDKDGDCNCCSLDMDVIITLYVPKTARLRVKSISSNVSSEAYQGNLNIDIISGDINIKNYSGDFALKTISGDIDVKVKKSSVYAQTVTGTIYADDKLSFNKSDSGNRWGGSKVKGTVGNADNELKLTTVSGSIFLRKI
ncbi:DUF4097 family beta strand repeat-containing protein [Spongiivirga citrea]|uniref:DUF4097 family beta strand repeat protein n=1 Tax=Spongiivirga citrea TaxID=1481457 RepID=A0A6M0CI10_9FLAO|nr:DUF4097 family beta strand repeat-containing protein [Spongiivirga citrea]NER17162.1 hypothetical protein [Spongiivirga citrea]